MTAQTDQGEREEMKKKKKKKRRREAGLKQVCAVKRQKCQDNVFTAQGRESALHIVFILVLLNAEGQNSLCV